jgi:hypothetical protein
VSPSHHGKLISGAAGATNTLGPNSFTPGGTVYQYGMALDLSYDYIEVCLQAFVITASVIFGHLS